MRDLPRITVRGQTVQGVRLVLRKAPLPSRMCPWSTRRHCGPLAFRRATEGSRVLRRVRGSQEGAREPYGALAPFCPCRWAPTIPPPPGGGIPVPPKAANFPLPWERHLRRQTAAFPQNPTAGSGSAQIPRVFFNFPCLQLTFPIFHGILNYRKQKEPMPASISSLINGIRHLVLPTPAGGKISPKLRPITRQMAHTAYLYNYYTINKRLCQYDARFSTKINFSSLYDTFYLCNITNFRFLVRI